MMHSTTIRITIEDCKVERDIEACGFFGKDCGSAMRISPLFGKGEGGYRMNSWATGDPCLCVIIW
jgi:ADP-ribosylglycohydrolase